MSNEFEIKRAQEEFERTAQEAKLREKYAQPYLHIDILYKQNAELKKRLVELYDKLNKALNTSPAESKGEK